MLACRERQIRLYPRLRLRLPHHLQPQKGIFQAAEACWSRSRRHAATSTNSTSGPARAIVGQGATGEKQAVPPGTYEIFLHTRIGDYATREGVTIQAGDTARVDFSPELGVLELVSPPSLKQPFAYLAEPGNWDNGTLSSDVPQCGLPGRYSIHFATSLCDGPNGSCRSLALFGDDALPVLAVEVHAGETTRLSPDAWTSRLGLLSFASKFDEMNLAAEISRSSDGKRVDSGGFSLRTNTAYWALPGSYDVVLTDPYVNLPFRNVVVKAGEKTEVTLPKKPSR